jgi:hypothetical protein
MLFTAKRPSHLITSHRTCTSGRAPHRTVRPRRAHGLGAASERARVWFTVLLLPASQVMYTKSTF